MTLYLYDEHNDREVQEVKKKLPPLYNTHDQNKLLNVLYTNKHLFVSYIIRIKSFHYSNVIMNAMASRLFAQPFVEVQIKETIKAPCHWPLWGESTGHLWIPLTKGQ